MHRRVAMIKRPLSRALLAAVVGLLAACGTGASGSTEKRAPAPRTLVSLVKTGGFAGISERVVVRRSGRMLVTDGRLGGGQARASRLGPRRLRGVRRAIRRAALPRHRAYTEPPPVADAFHYRLATPGHVVAWDSPGGSPPARITRLAARLERLAF
jgi:hypothetical protein